MTTHIFNIETAVETKVTPKPESNESLDTKKEFGTTEKMKIAQTSKTDDGKNTPMGTNE